MIGRLVCAGCMVSLLGCSDLARSRLSDVLIRPQLSSLELGGSALHTGGVLAIVAVAADPSMRVLAEERLQVRVRTESGDAETVELEREVCDGGVCGNFSVSMDEGVSVTTLLPLMAEFPHGGVGADVALSQRYPARFTTLSETGRSGRGYVWRNADMPRFMSELRSEAGVRLVSRVLLVCGFNCPPRHSYLAGYRPLDDRTPQADNGWIEAHPGDTITVSYLQPNGGQLTSQVVMGSP